VRIATTWSSTLPSPSGIPKRSQAPQGLADAYLDASLQTWNSVGMILNETNGNVSTIKLNRPEALNALTPELLNQLVVALETAASDASVTVVVLTGAGRAFCAGVDLKALAAAGIDGGDVSDLLNMPARRVAELLSTMEKVTVAKINGACFTGALELALACDIMIAADEAKMGDTHAKWGLRPTWGMSQRLVAAVGITRARWLSHTARTFLGSDAAAWGMAAESCPLSELDMRTDALVAMIAEGSLASQRAYKDLYRAAENSGLLAGLAYEFATEYPMSGAGARLNTFGN
jgi:enoyl-CoA hydratase